MSRESWSVSRGSWRVEWRDRKALILSDVSESWVWELVRWYGEGSGWSGVGEGDWSEG